jgi:hypothetical protein
MYGTFWTVKCTLEMELLFPVIQAVMVIYLFENFTIKNQGPCDRDAISSSLAEFGRHQFFEGDQTWQIHLQVWYSSIHWANV